MFRNRSDAGEQLAEKLQHYKERDDVIVVGLPRGGVPVAYEISQNLNLPLDIVCPRKIGAPGNKEFAIGAITETGEGIFDTDVIDRLAISQSYIDQEVAKEKKEARNRLETYRKGRPPRNFQGKSVIIVDDGLATGSTMKAAIKSLRSEGAEKIIVAIPVSPPDTLEEIQMMVDETVCLGTPAYFQAVGQFYNDFSPTEDEEVIALMRFSPQK
jgi:putative phosphoribosyl transferase